MLIFYRQSQCHKHSYGGGGLGMVGIQEVVSKDYVHTENSQMESICAIFSKCQAAKTHQSVVW